MAITLSKAGGLWSHSRSSIPTALIQAGVPEETWFATFDGTVRLENNFSPVLKKLTAAREQQGRESCLICMLFLFCIGSAIWLDLTFALIGVGLTVFACLLKCFSPPEKRMKEIEEQSSEHIRTWGYFVEEQQVAYRPYGIQVNVVKDAQTKVIVGCLRFAGQAMHAMLQLAGSSPLTPTRTIIEELESLYQLHQSGGLSVDEYSQVKTKIIYNTPQISHITNAASAEVISPVEDDSTTPNGHGVGKNYTLLQCMQSVNDV